LTCDLFENPGPKGQKAKISTKDKNKESQNKDKKLEYYHYFPPFLIYISRLLVKAYSLAFYDAPARNLFWLAVS